MGVLLIMPPTSGIHEIRPLKRWGLLRKLLSWDFKWQTTSFEHFIKKTWKQNFQTLPHWALWASA
jgi:hypothetical protein